MSEHHDDADNDLDDRELPDAADRDSSDEGDDLEPCPSCGKEIYANSDICHHCGTFIIPETDRSKGIVWIVIVVTAGAAVIMTGMLMW